MGAFSQPGRPALVRPGSVVHALRPIPVGQPQSNRTTQRSTALPSPVTCQGDYAATEWLTTTDDLFQRPQWHAQAACRGIGTAAHFPATGEPLDVARALCARCTVREPCLAFALTHAGVIGVWAGTTDKERRRRRRGRAA